MINLRKKNNKHSEEAKSPTAAIQSFFLFLPLCSRALIRLNFSIASSSVFPSFFSSQPIHGYESIHSIIFLTQTQIIKPQNNRKKKRNQETSSAFSTIHGLCFTNPFRSPKMATTQNTHLDLEAAAVDGGCSRLSDASEDSTTVVGLSLSLSSSSSSSSEEEEEEGRRSAVSEYSVVDLGGGGGGGEGTNNKKVHNLLKIERDCRICHLSLDLTNQDCENGIAMELGCCCKEDLAAAHKHCAEAWFKIKGNKTCEICGSIAHNVAGANEAELMEHWNEANDAISSAANAHGGTTTAPLDNRNFWRGHRFLNFLLACMVFAFVISWLFHFNVPS